MRCFASRFESNGLGMPVMAKKPADYGFPTASLKSQADVLEFAAGLEKGAASAYLGAVPTAFIA